MPKIVCVKCQVEFVIEKSGAVCCDMFNKPPQPYRLHHCDAWKCPSCGVVILAGFGNEHYAEHYENDFKELYDYAKIANGKWFIHNFEHIGDKDKHPEWKGDKE